MFHDRFSFTLEYSVNKFQVTGFSYFLNNTVTYWIKYIMSIAIFGRTSGHYCWGGGGFKDIGCGQRQYIKDGLSKAQHSLYSFPNLIFWLHKPCQHPASQTPHFKNQLVTSPRDATLAQVSSVPPVVVANCPCHNTEVVQGKTFN